MAYPSVCPSVCQSQWYCIEMNEHTVKLFPSSGRGMTGFFLSATAVTKCKGELPQALNTKG